MKRQANFRARAVCAAAVEMLLLFSIPNGPTPGQPAGFNFILSNDQIIGMHKTGVKDEEIIKTTGYATLTGTTRFDLSPKRIDELRKEGVSAEIVVDLPRFSGQVVLLLNDRI